MVCLFSIGAILFLIFFDVQYFLRIITTVLLRRLFEKKKKVTDQTTIYGFCFTQDLDFVLKHMNNARFLRDVDFARFHYYDRTGLYEEMVKRKTDGLQAATSIRYRKVIPIFSVYKIVTQLLYWDERSIYLEQKFITMDGFVRAIVLSKQTLPRGNVDDVMQALNAGPKPEPPEELKLWMKSIDVSSEKLRPKKD